MNPLLPKVMGLRRFFPLEPFESMETVTLDP